MLAARRRTQTKKVIKKRLGQLKRVGSPKLPVPGKLAKFSALGCRKSKCKLCRKK